MDTAVPFPLIEAEDAGVSIGSTVILTGIAINTSARRIALVGRNGSGKTTLARLLAGLVAPRTGLVRIDGVVVAKDRRAALGTVGILFQNPDHQIIFPTVIEEVGFGLRQMGQSKADVAYGVETVLQRFDRAHWCDAAIHQMSQGQRQLVCLMAVLVMAPRVIILDEPFAGLDIPTAMHLTRVLAGLDVTLVQVTHDPKTVSGYDHAIWLEAGQIVRQGPAGSVLAAYERAMKLQGAKDDLADLAS